MALGARWKAKVSPSPGPAPASGHPAGRGRDVARAALLAVPVLAWAGVLFWLSAQPSGSFEFQTTEDGRAFDIPGRDLLAHGALYFVLGGFVWLWARIGLGVNGGLSAAVAVGLAVLYGVSDEWHQSFVPGRTPDARDIVADGLGALAAALVLWAAGGIWNRRVKSSSGDENAGR